VAARSRPACYSDESDGRIDPPPVARNLRKEAWAKGSLGRLAVVVRVKARGLPFPKCPNATPAACAILNAVDFFHSLPGIIVTAIKRVPHRLGATDCWPQRLFVGRRSEYRVESGARVLIVGRERTFANVVCGLAKSLKGL